MYLSLTNILFNELSFSEDRNSLDEFWYNSTIVLLNNVLH